MTDPEDKQLAAIREEESDFTEALQEANDILYPDPAKALAVAISERKTAVREWTDCLKRCDALTAERDDLRAGLSEIACCFTSDSTAHVLSAQTMVFAIGDMTAKIADLSSSLKTAEEDAETQRTAAADLRNALDRVAVAAGVDSDSTGAIVADLVIKELREAGRTGLAVAQCRTIKDAADILFRDAASPGAPCADRRSDLGSALLAIASGRTDKNEAHPAALPADLRAHLEKVRNAVLALGCDEAEVAAIDRWLALPTAEVAP